MMIKHPGRFLCFLDTIICFRNTWLRNCNKSREQIRIGCCSTCRSMQGWWRCVPAVWVIHLDWPLKGVEHVKCQEALKTLHAAALPNHIIFLGVQWTIDQSWMAPPNLCHCHMNQLPWSEFYNYSTLMRPTEQSNPVCCSVCVLFLNYIPCRGWVECVCVCVFFCFVLLSCFVFFRQEANVNCYMVFEIIQIQTDAWRHKQIELEKKEIIISLWGICLSDISVSSGEKLFSFPFPP